MITEAVTLTSESVASVPYLQEINPLSQIIDSILASLDVIATSIDVPIVEATLDTIPRFQGTVGALIVSLIAFTIVFSVLAALCAMIYVNRYIAMVAGSGNKTDKTDKTNGASAPQTVSAPAGQTTSDEKEIKKLVAAISAAICASTGRRMNVISVTPAVAPTYGNCPSMTPIWRAAGIAECMESRLGSRSW